MRRASQACGQTIRFFSSFCFKMFTLLDLCVSSLRRGHANLLCIVQILTDDPRRESSRRAAKRCQRSTVPMPCLRHALLC